MKYSFKCPDCGQEMNADAKTDKDAEKKISGEFTTHNRRWHSEKSRSAEKLRKSVHKNVRKS